MLNFLKDVKLELSRVNWPSRQDTVRYTTVVIVFSVVMSVFLGSLDAVFSFVLNKFILN